MVWADGQELGVLGDFTVPLLIIGGFNRWIFSQSYDYQAVWICASSLLILSLYCVL